MKKEQHDAWVVDQGELGLGSLGVVTELGRSAFDRGGVIAGLVVHLRVG